MPVVIAGAGTVNVSGLDGAIEAQADVEVAEQISVYGLPAQGQTAADEATSAPDAVRARVLDSAGNFLQHLPYLDGLRWTDELNSAGNGSIDMLRFQTTETTTSIGVNLATNPDGSDGDTDWSPPLALISDTAPGVSPPAATALKATAATGFGSDFYHDPINVGAAVKTVRVTMWGYVTGGGSGEITFYRSNSDFSASEAMTTPVTIDPADGWVEVTADFDTSVTYPYVVAYGIVNAFTATTSMWVTALSVQVITTTFSGDEVGELDAGSQIVISVGSLDVFRLVLDSEPGYRIDPATASRIDAWGGMGALSILNSGIVFPEYGWRPEGTNDRTFDYGSNPNIGGWLVAKEWRTPIGKLVRKSWRWTYRKRHLPKGWPDRKAQWLWWKNPDGTGVPDEICYFRSAFTLSSAARVKFWVCGDDTLEFQVDGEVRATAGPGDWKSPKMVVLQLAAGAHYIAAKVQNTPATDGNANRSGFLCTAARISSDGDIIAYVRRSNPATWTVRRQMSGPPGWFPAQILRQLAQEQKTRACAGHSPITFGFSTTADSAGRSWVGRRDVSIPVGTKGLDWVQQIVEMGVDVAMSPMLRLDAWRGRGADRSTTVRIDQGDNAIPTDESGSVEAGIRNVVYARARTGWVSASDATSLAAKGRRETMASLGGSRSATQTQTILRSLLPDLAAPPQTLQVSISGASGGPQPYKHFNVGDWISYRAPGRTAWSRFRVMSIAGEVNSAGHPDWTIQLYEDA